MDLDLAGKVCLVTGAGVGLGRAIALGLAAEGASLALSGRRAGLLDDVNAELRRRGLAEARIFPADLTTAGAATALARDVLDVHGHVDVLVNNAGGSRPLPADGDHSRIWAESFALNFTAGRDLAETCLPAMKDRGFGRIINISGAVATKSLNAAAPAKAALQSWSRSLAAAVARSGITVNCIAPGRFDTEQIRNVLHPTEESRAAFIAENIPMGRFGHPDELALVAIMLASPRSGYVSGTTIPVDGGMFRLAM